MPLAGEMSSEPHGEVEHSIRESIFTGGYIKGQFIKLANKVVHIVYIRTDDVTGFCAHLSHKLMMQHIITDICQSFADDVGPGV